MRAEMRYKDISMRLHSRSHDEVMVAPNYDDSPVAVRDDITAAHRATWEHIARPGSWWTGAERVAIAAEARHAERCALCAERKGALSPNAVSGEHESLAELPAVAVDAIHRIVTDPGRLSQAWFEGLLQLGLTDASYVELVAVVVVVMNIDYFAHALGVQLLPLPVPRAGEPTHHRPQCARDHGAWVATIASGEEAGPERDLYRGKKVAVVGTALSLVPAELEHPRILARAQYVSPSRLMDFSQHRSVTRAQMELVAARVSAINECFY